MILTERDPYVSEQIAKVPRRSGLLYLFDVDMPLWTQRDGDVQVRLLSLRETSSDATHFAIDFSMNSFQSGEEYAEKARRAFRLVDRPTAKEPLGFSRSAYLRIAVQRQSKQPKYNFCMTRSPGLRRNIRRDPDYTVTAKVTVPHGGPL